jgi:hypothetical protein
METRKKRLSVKDQTLLEGGPSLFVPVYFLLVSSLNKLLVKVLMDTTPFGAALLIVTTRVSQLSSNDPKSKKAASRLSGLQGHLHCCQLIDQALELIQMLCNTGAFFEFKIHQPAACGLVCRSLLLI